MPDITIKRRRKTSGLSLVGPSGTISSVTLKSGSTGATGPAGPAGPIGATGLTGARGWDGGPSYLFNEDTTDVHPGVGCFSFDNAVAASVTCLYFAAEDAFFNNLTAWIQSWDGVGGGQLILKKDTTGEIVIFNVSGAITEGDAESDSDWSEGELGYFRVPVTYVLGALYENADLCMIQFSRTGTTSFPFQTASFANPLNIDAITYKDWIVDEVSGSTTINLNNTTDGDAGMLEVIIDSTGGYTVTLGTMFTKKMGPIDFDATAGADNIISWRKVGTSNIVYTIAQIEV
jgi:hypothetical protein